DGALRQLEAVEAAAEHDIGEKQMGFRLGTQQSERRLSTAGSHYGVAGRLQHRDGRVAHVVQIVDHENARPCSYHRRQSSARQTPGEGFGRSGSDAGAFGTPSLSNSVFPHMWRFV